MIIQREEYLERLRKLRDKNLIKVVTGVRRSGKSTLLQLFQEELLASGVPKSRIISINFEERKNLALTDWVKLHDEIEAKLTDGQMNYIFLDEVQMVKDFERMVDSLFVKPNTDLYITGSNAFLLSGDLATLLSGRYLSTNILPLSFAEYVEAFPETNRDELFRKYLMSSAFPEAVGLEKDAPDLINSYIKDIYETVINKDIKNRYQIRDMANFERVVRFALDNIGNMVSAKSIADVLNAGNKTHEKDISHNTIDNYLRYLTEAYLLYKADRYDIKGKKLLKTQDKYYVVDMGFRNVLVGDNPESDLGHKLENLVYLELRRRGGWHIFVGKNDETEVDFVVGKAGGEREYYQVAYTTHSSDTLKRELEPLQKIRDNYQKFIISTDFDNSVYDGIRKVNVVDWLLGKN
jgi:predicted AAA+ superfamily ATPase